MTELVTYCDREFEVWFDYFPSEEGVGLRERIEIYRIELLGRRVDVLLPWLVDELMELVWDNIYKTR